MTSGAKNLERGLTIPQLLRPHKREPWLGLLAISGESVAGLLEPWPLKIVLDNVIGHKESHGWLFALIRGTAGIAPQQILLFACGAVAANLVLSGHEHVYEHVKPQGGVYIFVLGNSGELRFHNIRPNNDIDQVGFDTDRDFMIMKISGNKLYFQTISRTGATIDSGELERQGAVQAK